MSERNFFICVYQFFVPHCNEVFHFLSHSLICTDNRWRIIRIRIVRIPTPFWLNQGFNTITVKYVNRYRRGLQTCLQAKRFKIERSATTCFLLFFTTRSCDKYDSAPTRKKSRPLLNVFACIG